MVAAPSPLYRVTPPAATSAGRRDLTTPPVLALGGYYGGMEAYVQTVSFATQKYTIYHTYMFESSPWQCPSTSACSQLGRRKGDEHR